MDKTALGRSREMAAVAGATAELAQLEQYLDRAMGEVFGTMLGVSCARTESAARMEGQTIAALIGLAGAMSGTLVLQSESASGMRVAELMTGVGTTEVDSMVRDAMGEMANMVAGAWKGYDAVLSSKCLLSTPTVVVGSKYELFSRRATIRIDRVYGFEGSAFSVSVACERNA
jgi:chemotaxis protein CheX